MTKPRKMLGAADSPYALSLMRAIETQSNDTLARWTIEYADKNLLPIYEQALPEDLVARDALNKARAYRLGGSSLPELKAAVSDARTRARELDDEPAAQAALQACALAAGNIYTPTNGLGMMYYGTAALAYDQIGLEETPEAYDAFAATEAAKMEEALKAISIDDEPMPAKIKWNC